MVPYLALRRVSCFWTLSVDYDKLPFRVQVHAKIFHTELYERPGGHGVQTGSGQTQIRNGPTQMPHGHTAAIGAERWGSAGVIGQKLGRFAIQNLRCIREH
ncbi:hypothetical protein CDV31_017246 [Fusarium ambrosium]|uniref:Uncharacterized protein n=1 Tax=Fusarium ambrosium TaxID=131363 RepID=A0A428RMU4_9HYPO|nr:hypothetical protein CDV31_017246 [Fusarium ambrosium]